MDDDPRDPLSAIVRYRVGYAVYRSLWWPWYLGHRLLVRVERRLERIIEWAERA